MRKTTHKTNFYSLLLMTVLAGCTTVEPTESNSASLETGEQISKDELANQPVSDTAETVINRFSKTPSLTFSTSGLSDSHGDPIEKNLSREKSAVSFYEMPIGRFINEVFGNVLGLSFEIDDGLSAREDLVTVRSGEEQTHVELYRMARQVLLNYGVGIQQQGDLIRFVPASDPNSSEPPLFVTGSALPIVPNSHRTVFQFVTLKAVRENAIKNWIELAFKDTGLKVQSDATTNALVLQGPARVVSEAANTIQLLDRPNMRGRYSTRISPSFVSAIELATMLTDVLASEGIGAVLRPPFGSVIVLPMQPTNSVIVFAADPEILDHVKSWATELDQPVTGNASNDFFYYQVKNTSAEDLAQALSGVRETSSDDSDNSAPAGIFVDKNRNGLIFTGESKGWKSFIPIIKSMDRPARLVNVEVTVASVTLTNDNDLGIEWLFNDSHGDFNGVGQSNFGLGGSGFSYTLNNSGQVRFALNALSQDQRVSILSKPSILVKSGDTASIDVGQEVPIITSQSQSTDTGDAPVLQNITYRKTGVLLEVEPTVHSGNRVDLSINQEVSEVLDAVASSVDSPSIFNRKVSTTLTLEDGGAVILGGLISNSVNDGSNKIPGLGSIPGLGALFRSSGNQETKSELILVIQAYIIDIEEKNWDFNERLESKLKLLDVEDLLLD